MLKIYTRLVLLLIVLAVATFLVVDFQKKDAPFIDKKVNFWPVQSIDTVKFSRDPARQYATDPSFDATIDLQVKAIASTGANYIAIGTPYDVEFLPFLQRWVAAARKYGLNVWFRGNFAGWEGWFGYPSLTRDQHKQMLKKFILDNGDLFADGDIFTACTECENGGPGDPRQTGDISGHRQFLIDEYQIARNAFAQIGKNVATNYFPMNGDVASLVMDPATTQALGGIVVIDHYVQSPAELNDKVTQIAASSRGKVVLGEFGAPIPDLQGKMTDTQQSDWIKQSLIRLAQNPNLAGLNYWTAFGGSTSIFNDDGSPKPAVDVLEKYYTPSVLKGIVKNEAGQIISNASLAGMEKAVNTDGNGQFYVPYISTELEMGVSAQGYYPSAITNIHSTKPVTVVLKKQNESLVFKVRKLLYQNLGI